MFAESRFIHLCKNRCITLGTPHHPSDVLNTEWVEYSCIAGILQSESARRSEREKHRKLERERERESFLLKKKLVRELNIL